MCESANGGSANGGCLVTESAIDFFGFFREVCQGMLMENVDQINCKFEI